MNPHEDKASTDFKSVVSTIPPYPRKGTTPYYHKETPNEKKVFAFNGIFLNSCVSTTFHNDTGCPAGDQGQRLTVLFEYGSAELNEAAVRQLEEAAVQARENGDYVCLLGRLSYRGSASDQALGALDRAKNTAAIFLQEGVDLKKSISVWLPSRNKRGFPRLCPPTKNSMSWKF